MLFLSLQVPLSGSDIFLFGGVRNHAHWEPNAGPSSGAFHAPELRSASRTPACFALRSGRIFFFEFCKDFVEFWVSIVDQILTILGDFRG